MARIIDGNSMNMVGKNVRQLRIAKGMSQQALSNKLETLAVYILPWVNLPNRGYAKDSDRY